MIDRHRNGDELKEEFSVLGSTGNVSGHTVTPVSLAVNARMSRSIPSLSTRRQAATVRASSLNIPTYRAELILLGPDATKGNHCKHIVSIRPPMALTFQLM